MKPSYLELCAFGPFAGQVVLPLGQIVSEGVFLVHGATGAGKTTIFDAVSFALFGNASGENRPTDSFRSDFAAEDAKTYVILEFTHNGNTYKIERSPAYRRLKQRGQGYTDSKAEAVLTMPDGRIITGYQTVTDKVVEILGVDWKQFKQISMLAQGEFLKLLTVESKERGDIFRKVFHTGELGRIGRELKERMLKTKRRCEELDQSIVQYYSGIDNSAESVYKEKIEEFLLTKDIHKTEGFQEALAELVEADQAERELVLGRLKAVEQQLMELRVRESRVADWLEKKAEYEALEGQMAEMAALEQKNRQDKQQLALVKRASSLVRPQKEVYLAARAESVQLMNAIAEQEDRVNELRAGEDEVMLLYQKAQADKISMDQRLVRMEQLRNEVKLLKQKEVQDAELSQKEQEAEGLLLKEAQQKELLQKKEERIKECRKKQDRLTEIYHKGRSLEATERELKTELLELGSQEKKFENYEKVQAGYVGLTEQITELLKEKQKRNLELQQMEAAYTCEQAGMLAMDLEAGKPCPVCGSREHPMPAKPARISFSKEELGAGRQEYQEICELLERYGKEAASEKATMELLLQQIGIRAEGAELMQLIVERRERKALVEETLADVEKQIDVLVQEQEEGMRAREEATVLEQELEKEHGELELWQEKLRQVKQEQQVITQNIKRILLDVSFMSVKEAEEALEAQVQEQEAKKAEIVRAEQKYLEWQGSLQSETAVLEQMAGQKLLRMQKEQAALEDYNHAVRQAGFESEEELLQAMLSEKEQETLEEQILEAESILIRYKERRILLEQELSKTEPEQVENFKEQLQHIQEEKERLSLLGTELATRMDTNDKIRRNVETQLEARRLLRTEYGRISVLSNVANGEITGKDRLPFEQYVQAFYFEQVIFEANQRLKKMSGGRYALRRRGEAENRRSVTGLDLEIMDYFTGKARSVKSLSGGESFKAALSLALGLSDVIQGYAGGIVVETMFVDEGFGSLDKDSLEQAVAILKDLATDNRVVGIISHVEELKECIDKKILLEKSTKGSSISWKNGSC